MLYLIHGKEVKTVARRKPKKKNRKSKSETLNKLLVIGAVLQIIKTTLEIIKKLLE